MTILPKKKWHTLNADNREKVRKDRLDDSIQQELKERKEIDAKRLDKLAFLRAKKGQSSFIPNNSASTKTKSQIEKEKIEKFERSFDTSTTNQSRSSSSNQIPWYARSKEEDVNIESHNATSLDRNFISLAESKTSNPNNNSHRLPSASSSRQPRKNYLVDEDPMLLFKSPANKSQVSLNPTEISKHKRLKLL